MDIKIIPEVITEAYKDLLSPSFKNIGKALGTGADTLNAILLPVLLFNEKRRLTYAKHVRTFQENLDKIPDEKRIEIPAEISQPILDKFSYVANIHLSDMYHNLLITAASEDTSNIAHPGFIPVINRLSPDEAKILNYMKHMRGLPAFSMAAAYDNKVQTVILSHETCIHELVSLSFPQNRNMYFENLTSLGLLRLSFDQIRSTIWKDDYNKIEASFHQRIKEVEEAMREFEATGVVWNRSEHFYDITDFGGMFIKACIDRKG